MFVCLCNGITDSQIRRAASEGARSLDAIRDELGVASQCGSCSETAEAILAESHTDGAREPLTNPLFYPAGPCLTA
jgi:bacterioferritin-associated ferredoxin